jgi:SNF2 family DNA or RNA helicase
MEVFGENEHKMIEQSRHDKKLYPHQRVSVYNMEERERNGFIRLDDQTILRTIVGIQGDIVGYGKTLSMVTLMDRNKMIWDMDFPYIYTRTLSKDFEGAYSLEQTIQLDRIDTTLITANQSLLGQWESEIKEASDLTYFSITTKKHIADVDPNDYDIILVSTPRYNEFVNKYKDLAWKRFIFDEVTSTHIPAMNKCHAGFTWFVSATWETLGNWKGSTRRHYVRQLFPKLMNYMLLKSLVVKNDDDLVALSVAPQTINEIAIQCSTSHMIKAVHSHVPDNVAKLLAAGDIKGAIQALGGEGNERIDQLIRKRMNESLFDADKWINHHTVKGNGAKIAEWTTKKNVILEKIEHLEARLEEMLQEDCSICFDAMNNPVMCPHCMNMFCGECLLAWIDGNNSCPLCRAAITSSSIIVVNNGDGDEKEEEKEVTTVQVNELQTKPLTIVRILNENPGKRFIVFSSSSSTFNTIRNVLPSFAEITGTKSMREKKIEKFKIGENPVVFLNSQHNGAGINLQCADCVILYHRMDTGEKKQSIGRANRLGRDPENILQVYQLYDAVDQII